MQDYGQVEDGITIIDGNTCEFVCDEIVSEELDGKRLRVHVELVDNN